MKNQIQNSLLNRNLLPLVALLSLLPAMAHAHISPEHGAGFVTGLGHPLQGLEHLLAAIAVGLWAAQLGGRSLWLMPATFVSLMSAGVILGTTGVPLPLVEPGILVSVLVLGILVVAAARLPLVASVAVVGLFALFHGHAHGAGTPVSVPGLIYGLGLAMATACLQACGIGFGLLAQKRFKVPAVRLAGAAIVAVGLCLWLS